MWKSCSCNLKPLRTASLGQCKGAKILWNDDLEQAFNDMKKMICDETILNYPDWEIPFTIHTYASDKHLGAVISQNDKPVAFFSFQV